eukprot:TRINITY_DN452_c0_g1_i1.p1 TRINITY_DN452_c0_g1~~TRINITY_DN452_c0_g1_i1.p1  ORF type:complete len:133 (-),score=33.65 TRINITY_DN452_c0_g1_i1:2-400(-)
MILEVLLVCLGCIGVAFIVVQKKLKKKYKTTIKVDNGGFEDFTNESILEAAPAPTVEAELGMDEIDPSMLTARPQDWVPEPIDEEEEYYEEEWIEEKEDEYDVEEYDREDHEVSPHLGMVMETLYYRGCFLV